MQIFDYFIYIHIYNKYINIREQFYIAPVLKDKANFVRFTHVYVI